jgi:hypothetical protein
MAMEKMTKGTTKKLFTAWSWQQSHLRARPYRPGKELIVHARAALFVQQLKANIVVFDGRV